MLMLLKVVCSRISSPTESDKVILKSIFKAATVYFNYTGEAECLDASDEASGTLGAGAWDFQVIDSCMM
jgi:lysosomal Pro-X carboxypeptidase